MSTVAQVKVRLADILNNVAGLRKAYAYSPRSLPPTDLPAVLVFTGPARYDNVTLARGNMILETRAYLLRLLVQPVAIGIDGEAEMQVETFLRTIPAAVDDQLGLPHPTSGVELDYVQQVTALGDNGIGVFVHNGDEYMGAEFRIEVETYVQKT